MAQRTGAERLLAPLAKSASAGVSLALALAALLLGGCGGGSSAGESDTTQAPAGSGAASSPSRSSTSPGTAQGAAAGASEDRDTQSGGGGAANPSAPGAPGQKQGPPIATPQGPPEQAPTPEQIATATVADMSLQSPQIPPGGAGGPGALPAPYTCDGKDSWPTLRFSGVPPDTQELAIFAMNVQPVEEKLFVDWAVAGLDPELSEIEAGKLPKGAVVGANGFGKRGYSICPQGQEIYIFAIYALPQKLGLDPGFDARLARQAVLDVSGNVGLLPALYAR